MAKDVRVKITGDSKGLTNSVNKSTKSLKGMSTQANSTAKSLLKMGVGFVSFTAILNQAKKGFTDLISETAGMAKVNSVIASTGSIAGITAKQIEDLTLGIQKTTTTSQDAARETTALGLTFTNINKDVFPEYMSLANDMATITGGDMTSSALQLGKALQDPVLGATSLSRVGVNLTQVQKDQIKAFQASGQAMKAQSIILKELRTEFGGAAKAVGQTFFGTVKRANNAVDDFRKQFIKGFGTDAFGGAQLLFEYIIDNQEAIGENFRKIAYDFTHNFIFEAIKDTGKLLKFSFDGWMMLADLWKDFFGDSFFGTVIKGWKMLFIVVESGWKMIIETVTNGIIDPIEKTFNKIKAVGSFLSGGNYGDALAEANKKNAEIDNKSTFASNMTSLADKMNERIFSVDNGLDTRQSDANYALDKAMMDLTNSKGSTGSFGDIMNKGVSVGSVSSSQEDEWTNASEEVKANNEKVRQDRIDAYNAEAEQRQLYYDSATSIINQSQYAMVDSINFFANKSIETFTKMSTSIISSTTSILKSIGEMGGGGGLFGKGSSILGTLGIVGAGIGLAGGLYSALSSSSESESVSAADVSDDTATAGLSNGSSPSSTVSKTQQNITNNFNNTYNNGVLVGSDGMRQFTEMITANQLKLARMS